MTRRPYRSDAAVSSSTPEETDLQPPVPSLSRVVRTASVLVLCALGFAAAVPAASAAPVLSVTPQPLTRVEPGDTFTYRFAVENVGDEASSGTIALDVDLPAGVTGVSVWGALGVGTAPVVWSCDDPSAGPALHCETAFPVDPGQVHLEVITLEATVDPDASGVLRTEIEASGGGAAAPSAATALIDASATPSFRIAAFDGAVLDEQQQSFTRAGGHPYTGSTTFELNRRNVTNAQNPKGAQYPDGGELRDAIVDLPAGLIGNPTAVTACPKDRKIPTDEEAQSPVAHPSQFCPISSIVGEVVVTLNQLGFSVVKFTAPVFNLEPPPGVAAQFGFSFANQRTYIDAQLRNGGDYGVRVRVRNASQAVPVLGTKVTLWGVPGDPRHDTRRCLSRPSVPETSPPPTCDPSSPVPLNRPNGIDSPLSAFIVNPTACTSPGVGLETSLSVTSWMPGLPADRASFVSHDPPGYPLPLEQWGPPQGPTDCATVPFAPNVDVEPTSRSTDSPTGLGFSISVPTDGLANPVGVAQSHLKKAVVTLPEGMVVNPSSADGLGACSEAQIGLGSDAPVDCPDSSKVGSVTVETPLLDDPVQGAVYLAEQGNRPGRGSNPFGSLLALYIVVESKERGVLIKLPGRVDADPQTGRLRTTFDNNPQLPFSKLHVELKSGPRAPLVTPSECGTHDVVSELHPWARPDEPVIVRSSFVVDGDCGARGFAPDWSAGSVSPLAGTFSPFVARFSRGDRDQVFGDLSVSMPEGLLAKLAGIPLCSDAAAGAGDCPAGSRVGSATAGAGAGPNPFYLRDQPVYLTGPYRGAPYGLTVVARAVAGPFDLGTVVVRQAIHVDPLTAEVRIASDPLPRILDGIPLNIRDVRVVVDRPQFTVNPSGCSEQRVAATFGSTEGASHGASSRFQVGDCAALPFRPRLALRLTGRRQTRTGRHPGVRARVVQPGIGASAIANAKVVLPKSLALDPDNAQALCEFADGTRADPERHCPRGSIVGRARAVTPLLDRPLSGNVYFVKNVRRSSSGNLIRTLPMIVVALRGQIAINLKGVSSTTPDGRLVNTFAQVPDAPVTRFDLSIAGGSNGILTVTRTRRSRIDLCARPRSHRADVEMRGQNGKRADFASRVKTPCRARASR